MPILPGLKPLVDAIASAPPSTPPASVAQARTSANAMMDATLAALQAPTPPVESESEMAVPVDGGEITVRIYRPRQGLLPVHVYFHGGGFWVGTLDQSDGFCRAVAAATPCVVVSVDYRLAPEAKFPVPAEDCYAALVWTADNAQLLDIDPTRISVGGGSAGGNLAAVSALMARDRGGPSVIFQVLEIPVTDLTMGQPSIEENAAGPLLTKPAIESYVGFYLADPADAKNPYASPLFEKDLTRLPPALVLTAELDPLRDEGEAYAARLSEAGIAVEHIRWPGQFHGAQRLAQLIPDEAAEYDRIIIAALQKAFGG